MVSGNELVGVTVYRFREYGGMDVESAKVALCLKDHLVVEVDQPTIWKREECFGNIYDAATHGLNRLSLRMRELLDCQKRLLEAQAAPAVALEKK